MSQQIYKQDQLVPKQQLSIPAKYGRSTKKSLNALPLKVLTYLSLLVFVLLFLVPLIYLLNIALKSPQDFLNDPIGITTNPQWKNFADAWQQAHFPGYLLNSLIYTVTSTFLQVFFALMVAYPIARGYIRWGGFFSTLFLASLFLPNGLIPQFQLIKMLGLYNTQVGYILLSSSVGIAPFLIMGYMRTIPRELDEAAAIDGCGYFRCLFTIITPLIKPILVTAAILHSIGIWNDIIGPTIYLTNSNYFPISLGLNVFKGQFSSNLTVLGAATLLAALPLIIVYVIFQRYFIEGAVAGAVK